MYSCDGEHIVVREGATRGRSNISDPLFTREGISTMHDTFDSCSDRVYHIGKNKGEGTCMSIVYIAMSSKGIVFSADSRLCKDGRVATDKAKKVFQGNKLIAGISGFAEGPVHGEPYNLNDSVDRFLRANPDADTEKLKKFISYECDKIFNDYPGEMVNLSIGSKDEKGYYVEVMDFQNQHVGSHVYHTLYDVVCMGVVNYAVRNVWIPQDMDLDEIKMITSRLISATIKNANLAGEGFKIGGAIQSVTFS